MLVFHSRRAFSLIELVVVLVLMAIIASMATLSLRGVMVRYQLSQGVEVIQRFDAALRRSARLDRRGDAGEINRAAGRLAVAKLDESYVLPKSVQIRSVRVSDSTSRSVSVSGQGASPSYAIELSSGDASRWVLLVGGSGQFVIDPGTELISAMVGTR